MEHPGNSSLSFELVKLGPAAKVKINCVNVGFCSWNLGFWLVAGLGFSRQFGERKIAVVKPYEILRNKVSNNLGAAPGTSVSVRSNGVRR